MKLTENQRAFLDRIGKAAFINPFSGARPEVIRDLVAATERPCEGVGEAELVACIDAELRRMGPGDSAPPFTRVDGADAERLRIAHLFVVYYQLADPFDQLIEKTLAEPNHEPPVLAFAPAAIEDLMARGFSRERAIRAFTVFFQIRRAARLIRLNLPGPSACMERLRSALWNAIFSKDLLYYESRLWNRMEDFSVLLLGETGTGKGVAAQALGGSGYIPFDPHARRFAQNFPQSFVGLNLSQFPETLIESELFGHRKGAFTGAISNHDGVFRRCQPHGVLFLDEIGDVSTHVQIKLLNVLQERTFTPVGSSEPLPFSGRVLAATHQDLGERRASGEFRDDFYYRLCSYEIHVPPLRQRLAESPGELEHLVGVLLERTTGEIDPSPVLDALKRDLPDGYEWPGNVRELEQAVRRILLTGSYGGDRKPSTDRLAEELRGGELSIAEVNARYCRMLYERFGSYEEVARRVGVDRRTAKKHIDAAGE